MIKYLPFLLFQQKSAVQALNLHDAPERYQDIERIPPCIERRKRIYYGCRCGDSRHAGGLVTCVGNSELQLAIAVDTILLLKL